MVQRFLELTGRSKTERFEKTEENVDNRIQYVGQIAREGKLSEKLLVAGWQLLEITKRTVTGSRKKPKSRYHRNVRLAEARDWY